jgi:hypothetical protein
MVRICLVFFLMAAVLLVVPSCNNDEESSTTEPQRVESVVTQSSAASDTVRVVVDDFVGNITVKPGSSDSVHVVATKYAETQTQVNQIQVEITAWLDTVLVTATNPLNLSNAGVDVQITAPPDARLEIFIGVGNLSYEGRPKGAHSYDVGVGNIFCFWPADVNVAIDLRVAVGSISIEFPVDYTSSPTMRSVEGTIGSGDEGAVRAQASVGGIDLRRQ